ncbi:MAG: response regulator [Lachnospiraceae bacterium]|nr:response regulator [Lachnospiraceae bacterium]
MLEEKTNNRIMVIGQKETFLIRVLVKKIHEAGMKAFFVPTDVNALNKEWENMDIITCYLETEELLPEKVRQFLMDKMMDDNKQMILIGDTYDVGHVTDNMPGDLIYKVFHRPLDNEAYIETVTDYFEKISSGEFKKSILIVDDDPNYLGLVREWLKADYKVSMASSGLQAIKWLGKNKADLILLDYEMPVTDGPQVLEMLRSDSDTRDIPVIFLTGKSDKQSVMAVVALKPEGYFLKNIERNDLLGKLSEFFTLRKL